MPDFIYARGTFYAVTDEGVRIWFCSDDVDTFSFLKEDYPARLTVDHLTIAHQETDQSVERKFREWINSVR